MSEDIVPIASDDPTPMCFHRFYAHECGLTMRAKPPAWVIEANELETLTRSAVNALEAAGVKVTKKVRKDVRKAIERHLQAARGV